MDSVYLTPSRFHVGTDADDTLRGGPGNFVAIGLEGNDTLISQWDDYEWSLGSLLGGQGDTTYRANGDLTEIIDTGGNDTLHVPGYRDEFVGALVDGRDLVLVNEWSGQIVIVMGFSEAGHIETFVDAAGQRFSGHEVTQMVEREGLGEISFSELQQLTGEETASPQQYAHARELDHVLARLDWDNVFQHLAERGSQEPLAIAEAIEYEALPLLSAGARRMWQESNAFEALANSEYLGIADNLPDAAPRAPVLERETVEDMALLYQAALDRQPDNAGLTYFVGNLRDGQSLQQIANSFYAADEFRNQFERFDDASYINQLYLNVLERPADAQGTAYWLEDVQQNGRSHADVLVSFAQSAENRDNAAAWLSGLDFDSQSDAWLIG
ncbi:MAG: DUF4214 domain-containing protein [Pseudomonadota bacterium]